MFASNSPTGIRYHISLTNSVLAPSIICISGTDGRAIAHPLCIAPCFNPVGFPIYSGITIVFSVGTGSDDIVVTVVVVLMMPSIIAVVVELMVDWDCNSCDCVDTSSSDSSSFRSIVRLVRDFRFVPT